MPMKKSKKGGSPKPKKTSPFGSAIVKLELDCATLHVHEALVKSASAKLLDRFQIAFGGFGSCSSGPLTADLKAVSLDVGHVLVKWLYTGTYQLREADENEEEIGPSPSSPASAAAENLRIAFGVYSLAREYELSDLEVLAREQIALLGSATDVFTFSNVMVEAYPRTIGKDDKWMAEYITTRMKAALKDDHEKNSGPSAVREKEEIGENVEEETEAEDIPISKLLVKGMLEACREVVQQHAPVVIQVVPRRTDDEERKRTVSLVMPRTWDRYQREITVDHDLATPQSAAEARLETETPVVEPEPTAIEPADKRRASPDIDEWVFPSPQKSKERTVEEIAVPEPEQPLPASPADDDLWGSLSRKYKKKKGRRETILVETVLEPQPELEAEPAAEPAPAPEPEPGAIPESVYDDDPAPASLKKGKKDKKKKGERVFEVPPEAVEEEPETALEPVAIPESVNDDDPCALPVSKKSKEKKKKKKGSAIAAEPEPVEEIPQEPEPTAAPDDEPRDVWGFWGAKRSPRQSLS